VRREPGPAHAALAARGGRAGAQGLEKINYYFFLKKYFKSLKIRAKITNTTRSWTQWRGYSAAGMSPAA